MDIVHIDTTQPFQESFGGIRHVGMFMDSASRLQCPYEARDESAWAILGAVKRVVADTGVKLAFRTDNGAEYTNLLFVDYCNGFEIRRELTDPYICASTKRPRGE